MVVLFIIVFCLNEMVKDLYLQGQVFEDCYEFYGSHDNLEKYFILSFLDCPSSNRSSVENHVNGPLSVKEFQNLHFNDVLIDGDESDYVLYLKRYFLSLVVF